MADNQYKIESLNFCCIYNKCRSSAVAERKQLLMAVVVHRAVDEVVQLSSRCPLLLHAAPPLQLYGSVVEVINIAALF